MNADIIIFVRDNNDFNFVGENGWIKLVKETFLVDLSEKKYFFV